MNGVQISLAQAHDDMFRILERDGPGVFLRLVELLPTLTA
jgi:hypothetical protein